jgi:hypothetical protein
LKDLKEPCITIHGRATWYRGDGSFALWHIGTHHTFYLSSKESYELVCQYFACDSPDRQPALFADFTICPTEPFRKGAQQGAIIKEIEHPIVITDWPAPKLAREYVQGFYTWYASRVSGEYPNKSWGDLLWLAHWDLSVELAKLLNKDVVAQSNCGEIIGIDFDPFLLTQDPAAKYEASAVEQRGERYWVSVHRNEAGVRRESPDIIAEVAKDGGRWYFVNFHSPDRQINLLRILKSPSPACSVPHKPSN